jgi:hypothetical protein
MTEVREGRGANGADVTKPKYTNLHESPVQSDHIKSANLELEEFSLEGLYHRPVDQFERAFRERTGP